MNITGGKFNSRKVIAPNSDNVRPTLSKIRASIFNSLQNLVDFETATFLDAFSGSGIMSLEAVSRGFRKVISVEKDYKTAKIIKENFKLFNIKPNLITNNTLKVLDTFEEKFDVIFLDPPYNDFELYNSTINKISSQNILKNNGILVIECNKNFEYKMSPNFLLLKEKIYGDTKILIYKFI